MITIIDYGSGNLRSVSKALDHLGISNEVSDDPRKLKLADRVILPGVGEFGHCVGGVRERGFQEAIAEFVSTGRPLLGICVGMQLLVDASDESPAALGLGLIKGHCPQLKTENKIPHMGWNQVTYAEASPILFDGIPNHSFFYFVHSYHVELAGEDSNCVSATCDYGNPFAAALEKENLFATQFHPEKSQEAGLTLLNNFSSI